jgi:hypothetical protein
MPVSTIDVLDGGGVSRTVNALPPLGQALAAESLPVVLTAAQITTLTPPANVGITGTAAVSAASLPLPTGAATETTLAALNTKVTAVNTGAVVLATGSAVVGKVGIDQTTPKTTNKVFLQDMGEGDYEAVATSASNLVPFFVPLGIYSVAGAWQVTTGTNVSVIGVGNFA